MEAGRLGEAGTLLDFDRLKQIAEERAEEFQQASPFPHVVIDDFISPDVVDLLLEDFPSADPERARVRWRELEANMADGTPAQRGKLDFNIRGKDRQTSNEALAPPLFRELFWELHSSTFLMFLERLTGIYGLLPDPHMQGGGLHQIKQGGFLGLHADFNKHPIFDLDRRLNVLLFLNKDWPEEYGGHLQLWSRDMSRCEREVLPVAGRCAIVSVLSDSWHGHPHPLTCPPDTTRKSVAMYYYSNGRPVEEQYPPHPTVFRKVPGEGPS